MMTRTLLAIVSCVGVAMTPSRERRETPDRCEPEAHAPAAQSESRLRTCEDFDFVANAPLDRVFPLFGAAGERAWAEDWDPQFLWPADGEDREGMVFQVAHSGRTATWVNTAFDREANRIQYVYVLPEIVATTITLKLTPRREATHVAVRYERTALSADGNAVVRRMAEQDSKAGPEWNAQINRFLAADAPPERR
jgi:hypothetical protein